MRVESQIITLSSEISAFKMSFYPQIKLDINARHELALISLDMYHSIPNIDQSNNKVIYRYEDTRNLILIPTGSYEIEAINEYIQKALNRNGHPNLFEIKANTNTLKCIVHIKSPNTKVVFNRDNTVRDILGFDAVVLDTVGEHEGSHAVNILKVNSILVNCDVIDGSYLNSSKTPVLYSFFPNVPPGYKIVEKPSTVIYLPVSSPILDSIQIWMTDQNKEMLNIRNEVVTIRLHLKSTYYK